MKTLDILTIGEPLMEFAEVTRDGERLFLPGHGGDISNTAVAAARQGAKVAIFTGLGADHELAREHRRRLAAALN